MKRMVCLALCLAMFLTAVPAQAAEYTLPEKMLKQMEIGSGLKGSLMLTLSGSADWVRLLAPLSGVDIELRAIRSGETFQYQLYAQDGDQQAALTQLYGDDKTVALRSTLLPDTLLTMATHGDALNTLLGGGTDANPGWYSVAFNLLTIPSATWSESWAGVLEPYYTDIELWLKAYGAAPSVVSGGSGETLMLMHYDIPVSAVRQELKTLLAKALQDQGLTDLLKAKMTQAQANAYLNASLTDYYGAAIDGLSLDGTVTLEREITTMGEARKTVLSFPLPQNGFNLNDFSMTQENGDLTLAIAGADRTLTLVMKQSDVTEQQASYEGIFRLTPAAQGDQPLSASFTLKREAAASVDDDTRAHETTTWTLTAQPDLSHLAADDPTRASYVTFAPLTASLQLHFSSKNSNRNPTTLEIAADLASGDAKAALSATVKTASPWVLQDLPLTGGKDAGTLSADQRAALLAQFAQNALAALAKVAPAAGITDELPVPGEATPTSLTTAN